LVRWAGVHDRAAYPDDLTDEWSSRAAQMQELTTMAGEE
jgi:hypothetical protein